MFIHACFLRILVDCLHQVNIDHYYVFLNGPKKMRRFLFHIFVSLSVIKKIYPPVRDSGYRAKPSSGVTREVTGRLLTK